MEGIFLRDGQFVTKECMQNALTEFSNKHGNYFPIVDYNDLFVGEGSIIDNEYVKIYLNETSAKIYGASGLYGKINNFKNKNMATNIGFGNKTTSKKPPIGLTPKKFGEENVKVSRLIDIHMLNLKYQLNRLKNITI